MSSIPHVDNFFGNDDPLKHLEGVREEGDELVAGRPKGRVKGSSSFQHNSQRIEGLLTTANDLKNAKNNGHAF